MADLAPLKSDTFDCSLWLNESLDSITDDKQIDSFLASTAMKLHIMSQEYTDQLETSMIEFSSAIPQVLSHLNHTEENILNIQESLQKQTFDSYNSSGNTIIPGLDELSRLDIAKCNMEKCVSVLSEHTTWNALVRDTTMFLETGGRLMEVAEK